MDLIGGGKRTWILSPDLDRDEQAKALELFASFPLALRADRRLAAAGLVLAEALAIRWRETEEGSFYAHIDRLDEPMLDTLAFDFKVDWWDETYSLEEKRRTLKDSWRVHRMLGTKAAVETAIRAIYPETDAVEWFEYGGDPFHFRLYIDLSDVMGDETRPWHVMDRVNFYKSLRSHLDDIQFTMEAKQPAVLGLGTGMGANAALGVTEGRDVFHFRSALYPAEAMGAQGNLGVTESRDEFDFRSALYPAEAMGAQEIMGVREQPDVFRFSGKVRAGAAENGTRTLLTVPEDRSAPHRVSILRTGGSFVMTAPPPLHPTGE